MQAASEAVDAREESATPASGRRTDEILKASRLVLVLVVLLMWPGHDEMFEAPKSALVSVFGLTILGAALFGVRKLAKRPPLPIDLAVLVWLAIEILATACSRAPLLSVIGEGIQRDALLTSLGLAGLYVAARTGIRSCSDLRTTLHIVVAAVSVSSAYALVQVFGLDPIHWIHTAPYVGGYIRPFGTLGNPNLLGVVGAASISAALVLAVFGARRRVPLLLAALVCAAATLLTLSRAAWLAVAAGLAAGALLAWRDRNRERVPARVAWIAAASLALAAVIALLAGRGLELRLRFHELLATHGGSSSSRLEIWGAAMRAWSARLWFGHGPDTFALVFPRFQSAQQWHWEWGGLAFHAHSIYLNTLATRGIAGFLAGTLWAALLVACGVRAWRLGGESRLWVATLSAIVVALGVAGAFGALGIAGAALLVVSSAGFAALAETPSAATDAPHEPPGIREPAGIAALVVGVLVSGWIVLELAASHADRVALDLVTLSNSAPPTLRAEYRRVATLWSQRAVSIMPFDDALAGHCVEVLMAYASVIHDPRGVLNDAEAEARRGLTLMPERASLHQNLGLVLLAEAQHGDSSMLAPGEAAFARGFSLDPYNALAMIDLARGERLIGRPRVAARASAHAVQLYPDEAMPRAELALDQLAAGDSTAARTALAMALKSEWHTYRADSSKAAALFVRLGRDPNPPNGTPNRH